MHTLPPHLARILLRQRLQVLLHRNAAPVPVNSIELFNCAVECAGVGAAGALPHVLVCVSPAVGHAPAAKRAAAHAAHGEASGGSTCESDVNDKHAAINTQAPVKIQNRLAAGGPRALEGEDVLAYVEAVAVYALLGLALYTHQLFAHFFDFGLEF